MTSLKAVRAALQSSTCEVAVDLISLIDSGKLSPAGAKLDSLARRRFELSETSFPRFGKKVSTFTMEPSISLQDLKEDCLRELNENRDKYPGRQVGIVPTTEGEDGFHFEDDTSKDTNDGETIDKIIEYLGNLKAGFGAVDHIVTFQSEVLDALRSDDFEASNNNLHTSMASFTVAPSKMVLPFHHSTEGTRDLTVLSGSVFWVIWPPTEHNLQALKTAYDDFQIDFDADRLNIHRSLEGGIIYLQSEGEGVSIPPFCPTMGFISQASVLASYDTVTANNLIATLGRMPLMESFFNSEKNSEEKMDDFINVLLKWLSAMLTGEISGETGKINDYYKINNEQLQTLLRTWNDAKDDIVAMLGPEQAEDMQEIWGTFLIESKGRECKLCGKRIQNKKKLMDGHFLANHWPKENVNGRVDSMDLNTKEGEAMNTT